MSYGSRIYGDKNKKTPIQGGSNVRGRGKAQSSPPAAALVERTANRPRTERETLAAQGCVDVIRSKIGSHPCGWGSVESPPTAKQPAAGRAHGTPSSTRGR